MTSRNDDYHCPRCGKYLFSAYTVWMDEEERKKLEQDAAMKCKCAQTRLQKLAKAGFTRRKTGKTAGGLMPEDDSGVPACQHPRKYFCPASKQDECPDCGGFDVCCDNPECLSNIDPATYGVGGNDGC